MNGIWSLVVCLGVVRFALPVLAQDSSRTLFLVTSPEVLHAGTPTPLAVTFLADFPGRVVAEVEHGNTRVAQSEDFQGGLTRVLTLPPIVGLVNQNTLLNLTVRGYRRDSLLFTNTTTLHFSPRNVSSFIQTDKSHYRPGDTVKLRVVSLRVDHLPYKGRVDISILDPSGKAANRWESTGNLGIVLQEFILPQAPLLGRWTITTTVNAGTDSRTFTVENYEHRPFKVLIRTPPRVLVGDDVSGSVRALYPSGQPVQGTLVVTLTASALTPTQTKEIYGSTRFVFSKDLLQTISSSSGSSDGGLRITACVTDSSTGLKVNKTVKVHVMKNTFLLAFHDFPPTLKPSLYFSSTIRISRYDGQPLRSVDLKHPAVIEVMQRTSTMSEEATTLTPPVPDDGNLHIKFRLQDEVAMLFIRAKFQSSQETLSVYNSYTSPSGSYIQISPVDTSPAQIGVPLQLDVGSTFPLTELHYVVRSRGRVVAAGTKSSASFSLTPAVSWSPEACVTVYYIQSDGDTVSDTVHVPIDQLNQVSLRWSSDRAHPGEQVSLTVTAAEPRFQVGIVVMGTHCDAPWTDLDFRVEQSDNAGMLTTAVLQKKDQAVGPKPERDALMIERYWSHWMDDTESLLWMDTHVNAQTWTSEKMTVPDGVAALRAAALVMSDTLGLSFSPVPQKLSVSKDFSMFLDVPLHLVRGEEIVLEVHVINHLERDIEIILLLAQSEAFEFVLANRADVSVVNAQKLTLRSHVSAVALFPIRPVALGMMEITVDAVSAEASDSLVWRVFVKPEGVEQSFSKTLFLELPPLNTNNSRDVAFSCPPDVVAGSQRAYVALVGDILALSTNSLGSLLQMPLGSGEQNMIRFAPSIYVLQYLDKSTQDNKELRSSALDHMKEAYQRQLSYQREDGSFSSFGESDPSGSIWLTAFVLKCFIQAQTYMQVDQSVLIRAMMWLLKHQGPQGEFSEVGTLIHTEMLVSLDDGPVALTAYVLMALLEDESYVEMYPANVSMAQMYLENKVSSEGLSNYSLCLVAYALALANSPVAGTALNELSRRADYTDGVMMWSSSGGLQPPHWQPRSAQIEMTSYVLLALLRRGNLVEGIELMKWLSEQRNHLGSYGTTQDTTVALQALASYAAFSGANAIDLTLSVSAPASPFASLFHINSTNFQTYQSQEISADCDVNLNIYVEGRGFAVFQMNLFYNLDSKAFSQSLQHTAEQEAFSLDVEVAEEADHNHMLLSVCTRLKESQVIPHTGMVILDVGMLSGFKLSPGAAAPTGLIRKVEALPEKISLYLDSVNKSEVCIKLPLLRHYKVAHVQDAVAQVYDYYEPTRKATRTYNSDVLHTMDSCSFCGETCERCRPGISLIVPSPLSSRSVSSTTRCFISLFLGVTSFWAAA